MAYQPKFAKTPGKAPLPPVRQEKPKKKRSKAQWAALILLTILIVPASTMATAELLGRMYQNLERPKLSEPSRTAGMAIGQQVNTYLTGQISAARESLLSSDKPVIEVDRKSVV